MKGSIKNRRFSESCRKVWGSIIRFPTRPRVLRLKCPFQSGKSRPERVIRVKNHKRVFCRISMPERQDTNRSGTAEQIISSSLMLQLETKIFCYLIGNSSELAEWENLREARPDILAEIYRNRFTVCAARRLQTYEPAVVILQIKWIEKPAVQKWGEHVGTL